MYRNKIDELHMHYYCLPLFTERNSSNLEIGYCLGLSDLNIEMEHFCTNVWVHLNYDQVVFIKGVFYCINISTY